MPHFKRTWWTVTPEYPELQSDLEEHVDWECETGRTSEKDGEQMNLT